jgi:hypothetical protein
MQNFPLLRKFQNQRLEAAMAFESHQKVQTVWSLLVDHDALIEKKVLKEMKLVSLGAATSASVPVEHLEAGKVRSPEYIGCEAPHSPAQNVEKLLNQAKAVTESVDGPAQSNLATDDAEGALLMKVMEDAGAWVTVQMVMLLPEIETVAALQIHWNPTRYL